MKKYIVHEGDSMWSISKMTGVRLNLLMAANPQVTDPNRLRPGDVIAIPEIDKGKPGAPTPVPPSSGAEPGIAPGYFGFVWPHVVTQNETWESVSQSYATTVDALKRMNPNFRQRQLQDGDVIYIPAAAPPHTPAPMMQNGMPAPGMMPMMQNGMPAGPGMMPQMQNGMPAGPGMMPQMQNGMPAGHGMMPQMQNGMPAGPGMMPQLQYSAPPLPGYGPHTHVPRGFHPGYYPKALPYPGIPYPYPVYGPYSAPVPYRGPHGYPMTPYATNTLWEQAHRNIPETWYRDWDESSSWESSWDAEWEDGSRQRLQDHCMRDSHTYLEGSNGDGAQRDARPDDDDQYGGQHT